MRKLLLFVIGVSMGAVIGVALVMLLTPASGQDMRDGAREHFRQALDESARAAAKRRADLEKEYDEMTKSTKTDDAS
ncbi:MAG: YtxH domain-containing protein [Anaerolineales bacterium]|nr:YtxH domain-containing protein [Anaerolineales bacterium]